MKFIKFYSRYWAALGGLIFVCLAFVLGLWGASFPALQRLTILLFMALLFHQFEEYVFPGGFPAACNIALFGEKDNVSQYPLNQLSALTVNVVCAYPLYIVGIFLYQQLWYVIFLAYFTMSQILMHGIKMNKALHSWYCPGCLSALFVMLPMGIYVIRYIAINYDVPHYFWWAPVAAFPFVAALTILQPILLFKRKDTKFGFAKHEAENFAVKHGIASLWRNK